jgi:spore coat protein A, manganese oxidase
MKWEGFDMRNSWIVAVMASLLTLISACGTNSTKVVVVEEPSAKQALDPLQMGQFVTPLPIIPVAAPDTTSHPGADFYTVVLEQTAGYDFGLRKRDGSELINPATGGPLRSTVWGYTTNGIKAGYLGATIEARSTLDAGGRPVVVKYINNLKDASGRLLTKHLLTVDPTVMGGNEGEIRTVTHLHGAHVDPEFDGHPQAWITNDPAAKTGLPADPVSGRPARPDGNTVTYTYRNDQPANHLWYHDHAMGITRLNVYAGLAANYFLRDAQESALNLPTGPYEIPLVIQDKSFNEDGSLRYGANPLLRANGSEVTDASGHDVLTSDPEFFGNVIVVNGKAWPYLDVEPRKYRFRMVNGSDSRFYHMWLEAVTAAGAPVAIPSGAVKLIGTDGGLLANPVPDIAATQDQALLLSLAERADVVVDFSMFPAGTKITVRNDAATPFPTGDEVDANATTSRIMQFRIVKPLNGSDGSTVPQTLRTLPPLPAPSVTRYLDLQEGTDEYLVHDPELGIDTARLMILLNGLKFDDPVTETPVVGSVEDWVIINNTVDMHPIHLHLVDFQVIEKGSVQAGTYHPREGGGPPDPNGLVLVPDAEPGAGTLVAGSAPGNSHYRLQPEEMGRKDTVRVPPADEFAGSQGYVKIRARFDILGTYMWHCHILAHEDHEMMRPFRVVPAT